MSFFRDDEVRLSEEFLARGYVIAPAEDRGALDRIRDTVAHRAAEFLHLTPPADAMRFLDGIGAHVRDAGTLNELRLAVIDTLVNADWFHAAYFACGRRLLEVLIGNELAMQRSLGFSIQLPNDESSILPLHSDVWSEDSPFEAVLWIPLVDVHATKSMFALPLDRDLAWRARVGTFGNKSPQELLAAVEPELEFLTIPYGHVLCFTHTIMHGNRMNVESTARWSMNVRFKGLFTPYSDKRLGEFFMPITLRPASQIGLDYRLPSGFDG